MAIDPERVAQIEREQLEIALFQARLKCAAPAERKRLIEDSGKRLRAILDGLPAGPAMTDEEWEQWEREFDDEEPNKEVLDVVRAAQVAAQREVERRIRAGTLLAG